MKIVYMGTPDFAVPALAALAEAGHEIGYVVTQPDAVRDRGKKVKQTPVKEKALELGLNVLQPEKIKRNAEFFERIKAYQPDLIEMCIRDRHLPYKQRVIGSSPIGPVSYTHLAALW